MKAAFLLMSIISGLSLSAVGLVVATGRIPFAEDADVAGEREAVVTNRVDDRVVLPLIPQKELVNNLSRELHEVRTRYDDRLAELVEREAALDEQEKLLHELENRLEKVAAEIEERIVRIEESEKANLKRLAAMYEKMEPASASSLLRQLELRRAAVLLSLIGERQAAGILDATVSAGPEGAAIATEWSDLIRKIEKEQRTG